MKMKLILVLASLVLLGSSPFAEGASDGSMVTFKGSVLLHDGRVDPAQVRLVLKQRNAENELIEKSAYLKVPQGFYKTFRKSSPSSGEEAGGQRAKLRQQGEFKFEFEDVIPGTHTLDVLAIGLAFPQYRVEVTDEQDSQGEERIYVSANQDPNKLFRNPVRIKALGKVLYFDQRSGFFSLKTLMKNPMYVIIGLTALAAVFLPRMLDKDALEEMQKEMRKMEEAKNQAKAKQRISS